MFGYRANSDVQGMEVIRNLRNGTTVWVVTALYLFYTKIQYQRHCM